MNTNFFKLGFNENWAIWAHMAGGGIGAFVFPFFMSILHSALLIIAIVFLWEVYEFIKGGGKAGMVKIYGSLERWFYDSLGDITGALFTGGLTLCAILLN